MWEVLWLKFKPVTKLGYIAHYGYTDGSGEYYITIDSDECDGCGECVKACPAEVFEVEVDDYDESVAKVREKVSNELKYVCNPCKPISGSPELKCVLACPRGAITHSW